MHWVDLIIGGIFLYNIATGYQKGLILTLLSLISYMIASFIAKTYYLGLADWFQGNPRMMAWITNIVFKHIDKSISKETVDYLGNTTNLEEYFATLLRYPKFIEEYLIKEVSLNSYANYTVELVKSTIANQLILLLINILSIIVLFISAKIVVVLIGHIANQAFKLPLLSTVNHVGGVVAGGVKGIIMIFLVLLIMLPLATLSPSGIVAKAFEESVLARPMLNILFRNLFHLL